MCFSTRVSCRLSSYPNSCFNVNPNFRILKCIVFNMKLPSFFHLLEPVLNDSIPILVCLDKWTFFGSTSPVLRMFVVCCFCGIMGVFHALTRPYTEASVLLDEPRCMLYKNMLPKKKQSYSFKLSLFNQNHCSIKVMQYSKSCDTVFKFAIETSKASIKQYLQYNASRDVRQMQQRMTDPMPQPPT